MNNQAAKKHIYNDAVKMWASFVRRAGLWEFVMMIFRHFAAPHLILPRLKPKTFEFKKQKLPYFYHRYNITWVTERVLEVPTALNYLAQTDPLKVLEIGNVLSHYFDPKHTILDKFETGPGIVNEDILTYNPGRKFDLIISISTFEHIGYEDDNPDPEKVCRALEASRRLLNPGGKLVITVPMGYNANLDRYLRDNRIQPDQAFYFEKTDKLNWRASVKDTALQRKYCSPFPYANAILVAEFGPLNE
jgi:hypothetical protein